MRTVFFSAGLVVFLATYVVAAPQQLEKHVDVTEKVKSLTGETIEAAPKFWRAVLGDICQLPSFPRATGDPTRYIECVKSGAEATDRKDLGIWLLRECLPNYEFVASARRCKTVRSIRRQQQICDGPNSANYQFCPGKEQNDVKYVVRETRQAPIPCTCPNGEQNCVCPSPEILEPVAIVSVTEPTVAPIAITTDATSAPVAPEASTDAAPAPVVLADGTIIEESSVVMPDAPRAMAQTYGQCPCPAAMPNCICQPAPVVTQPPVAVDPCCAPQQQPPCQCQQPGMLPPPQPVTPPPQICPQQCPQPQSPSCECQPVQTPAPAPACPCPQEPSCQCQPQTP
uniref:Uncharacterized protein n=1 Tax=Plectus sambesii TaxID=2011161 RepID=A0A914XCK8_9BILA